MRPARNRSPFRTAARRLVRDAVLGSVMLDYYETSCGLRRATTRAVADAGARGRPTRYSVEFHLPTEVTRLADWSPDSDRRLGSCVRAYDAAFPSKNISLNLSSGERERRRGPHRFGNAVALLGSRASLQHDRCTPHSTRYSIHTWSQQRPRGMAGSKRSARPNTPSSAAACRKP